MARSEVKSLVAKTLVVQGGGEAWVVAAEVESLVATLLVTGG